MGKKILITPKSFFQAGEEVVGLLKSRGFEIVANTTGKTLSEEQMIEMCGDAEGLIVGVDPVTGSVLRGAKKLKAISKYGAGLDNIDLKTAKELGIAVDKAAGANAESVAELAVGMFFLLARNISAAVKSVKSGGWERIRGVELRGKTAGIIGLGHIGREVARMAVGLGMKITAYDPYINAEDGFIKKYSIKFAGRDEVIKEADFLTLHVPCVEETKHMINGNTLSMMKEGAYLVNVSRGELTDEAALYEALKSGRLAGAAQDVFSKEPPGKHPLLELDNFILTPHIGAYTKEANVNMAVSSTENLIRMLDN